MVPELVNKLDWEWDSKSEAWKWEDMTWQQAMDKIEEHNKQRYPPLTCHNLWFDLIQTPQETIPQYIRRLNTEMATSHLEKGLTKNQLLVQKSLSNMRDKKLKEDIPDKFKNLEENNFEECINYTEVTLLSRQKSYGHINLQRGGKVPPKR